MLHKKYLERWVRNLRVARIAEPGQEMLRREVMVRHAEATRN